MQIVSVPVFIWPDAVDVTGQDCLTTICDNGLVVNFTSYPITRFVITFRCPTFLVPTEIKVGVVCEKIDIVNKALPYVVKMLAYIVTNLYFFCCCVFVTIFLLLLFVASSNSSSPVQCQHHSQHPSVTDDKLCHWFHTRHHTSKYIYNGKQLQKAPPF